MREGDVALATLPQADRKAKNRPVVVLREMPLHRDVLVCGVSSQLQLRVTGFDDVISPEDDDFPLSGLLSKSLVRLGFLVVLPRSEIVGSIGSISRERHRRLLKTLSGYLVAELL
jgi:mRNA interferase MazF